MNDQRSIRDTYWADTFWMRRSLGARATRVCAWFVLLPVILWWLVRPILSGGWAGAALSLLFVVVVLGIAQLTGHAKRVADRRLIHARGEHYRVCPCAYDLAGSPSEGLCPECGNAYNPQSLLEHWEGGTYEQSVKHHWHPIGERRMWLSLTWWQWLFIVSVPIAVFLIPSSLPRGGAIMTLVYLTAIASPLLYIFRGHIFEWRALSRTGFRRCPSCLRSLRNAPTTGSCPKCNLEYTPEWLERTWRISYRRPVAQPGSDSPP